MNEAAAGGRDEGVLGCEAEVGFAHPILLIQSLHLDPSSLSHSHRRARVRSGAPQRRRPTVAMVDEELHAQGSGGQRLLAGWGGGLE